MSVLAVKNNKILLMFANTTSIFNSFIFKIIRLNIFLKKH